MSSVKVTIQANKKAQDLANQNGMFKTRIALKNEIIATTLDIHGDTRQNAPVDTGRLRASVDWAFTLNELKGEVDVKVDYAIYNERRKPFLEPAWKKHTKGLSKRIQKIIDEQ